MNERAEDQNELSRTVPVGVNSETADHPTTHQGSDSGSTTFTPPKSLGNYQIIDEIAQGGMGIVFRAKQSNLGRVVALKMILSDRDATGDAMKRFQAEAEAAGGLDHPNIVQIYEYGEFEGRPFFSMRYVEGQSLADRVANSPLDPREAAELMKTVADAIQFAHDRGIIHRDLKPANILIDREGRPHVTDFGLAKKATQDGNLTVDGQLIGTPFFMPPEQASSQSNGVTPRSDVYAIGATLYCLLTGRPPFQSASLAETLRQVIETDPVPPRQLNNAIPQDLETICLKCMEKDPSKRYNDASTLSDELGRFLRNEPIQARPLGKVARTLRWCHRNPVAAGLATMAAILLLTLGIGGSVVAYQQSRLAKKTTENATQQQKINQQREQSAALKEEFIAEQERLTKEKQELARETQIEATKSLHASYSASIALAYESWKSSDFDRARELLDRLRPSQSDDTDIRGYDWYYLSRLIDNAIDGSDTSGTTPVVKIETAGGLGQALALSPDGKRLAAAGAEGEIHVWDMTARPPVVVHQLPGISLIAGKEFGGSIPKIPFLKAIAFSSDGNLLATASNAFLSPGPVIIWDLESGESKTVIDAVESPIHDLFFSDGDSRLITVDGNAPVHGNIKYWDVEKGTLQKSWTPQINEIHTVDGSPNGEWLAIGGGYGDDRGEARIVDIESNEFVHELVGPTKQVNRAEFSPDGGRLVTVEGFWFGMGAIRIWNTETGEQICSLTGHTKSVSAAAFTPDGLRLATAGRDRKIHLWDAITGDHLLELEGHQADIYDLAFSADQSFLVSVAQQPGEASELLMWDASLPPEPIIMRGHEDRILGLGFVDYVDGAPNSLISLSQDRSLRIWDIVETGFEKELLDNSILIPISMSVTSDGRFAIVSSVGDEQFTSRITVWDLHARKQIKSRVFPFLGLLLDFVPGSHKLIVNSTNLASTDLQILNVPDLAPVDKIATGHMFTGTAQCSPDGNWIAVGCSDENDLHEWTIQVRNAEDGEIVNTLDFSNGPIVAYAISKDGAVIAVAPNFTEVGADEEILKASIQIMDARTGELLRELSQGDLSRDDLSGDEMGGAFLAFTQFGLLEIGQDTQIRMWNEAKGELVWSYSNGAEYPIEAGLVACLSGDRRLLATSLPDNSLQILDLSTGLPLTKMQQD